MLATDEANITEAERWFKQAVEFNPTFRSALFNLALLLADDNRPLEAVPFLNQLIRIHPDHVKALILLGDIYINVMSDLDAADNVSLIIQELTQGTVPQTALRGRLPKASAADSASLFIQELTQGSVPQTMLRGRLPSNLQEE